MYVHPKMDRNKSLEMVHCDDGIDWIKIRLRNINVKIEMKDHYDLSNPMGRWKFSDEHTKAHRIKLIEQSSIAESLFWIIFYHGF